MFGLFWAVEAKGQIKPKADWRAIDSPKKRTNEFDCYLCHDSLKILEILISNVKYFRIVKQKQICSFGFWENLRCVNLPPTVLSDIYREKIKCPTVCNF